MKKFLVISFSIVIQLFCSCNMIGSILGTTKNNISSWVPQFQIGSRYTYEYCEACFDGDVYSENVNVEVQDVEERSDRVIIKLSSEMFDYFICDKNNGEFLISEDEYISDDDMIILKTPIEEGSIWYDDDDNKYKITAIGEKTTGAGSFKNVVTVRITNSEYEYTEYSEINICSEAFIGWKMKYPDEYSDYGTSIDYESIELMDIDLP